MPSTKLILFEGIPGSGKSTAGEHLRLNLQESGLPVTFWQEGNVDHPADFEGVARLSAAEYQNVIARHAEHAERIAAYTTVRDADHLLSYRKLQHMHPEQIPASLIDELAHYDVYDGLPVEDYRRLALARWREFTQAAEHSEQITILECCLLQNPLTVMLARHDAAPEVAREHVRQIVQIIQSLNPLVIYLAPQNVRDALEHVRAERPKAWAEFVTWYLTEQAYGRAHGLQGYEGVIRFYEMRQTLEMEILREMNVASLVLEHTGQEWEQCQAEITQFVRSEL